jgi:DNA-binding PadR family transcriptional regulator
MKALILLLPIAVPWAASKLFQLLYRLIQHVKNRIYLILLALADADLHGLAIARAVQELSDGATRLWPVSLYGTLEELEAGGLIEELDDPRRPAESEKKRFYRLTRAGQRALSVETDRLAALVKVARSRLKPRPGDASTTYAKATVGK